jgi:hypothetical protein
MKRLIYFSSLITIFALWELIYAINEKQWIFALFSFAIIYIILITWIEILFGSKHPLFTFKNFYPDYLGFEFKKFPPHSRVSFVFKYSITFLWFEIRRINNEF